LIQIQHCSDFPQFNFPEDSRSIGMKTIVLAFVLASTLAVSAQEANQQPSQPAGGSSQASGPTIKDPAEYNAYVGAIQQQDPHAKISALEAFLTQYPNSVMKTTALEVLMASYQQTGDQAKVVETAKRLLTVDSCSLRALALLTFLSRQAVAQGQQASLGDLTQYSDKGLECLKTAQKPAGMSDADYDKLKQQVAPIFNGGCGFAALQNKDYPKAQLCLKAAVEAQPNDLQNVYPLAMSYLTPTPPDTLDGLFYIARAASLATGAAQTQIQSYGQKVYQNYHGSTDGWSDLLNTAKTETNPPADLQTKVTKYVPPTPAQQAHDVVNGKTPDQIKQQLGFGDWELVLSAGLPADQDAVWNVIKGVPLQMEGKVIEATSPTELHIAGSEDDIEANRADITLTMSGPIPAARLPKTGDTFDFEGTPSSYTATPFMMMMSDGKLLKKAGEPAKKPVHRRPVQHTQTQ
jgi:tetratricopeptide (TPR) repeat protein